jgi:cysteine synthase
VTKCSAEGIGNSVITANMEGMRENIDDCLQIDDHDAIRMVFRLLYEEVKNKNAISTIYIPNAS